MQFWTSHDISENPGDSHINEKKQIHDQCQSVELTAVSKTDQVVPKDWKWERQTIVVWCKASWKLYSYYFRGWGIA